MSFELTLIYVDKRLLTQKDGNFVYFHSNSYDFLLYSRKELRKGENSLRLPSGEKYKHNMKKMFKFSTEREMYMWLKKLHRTINEANDNYTPFVKDPEYVLRPNSMILNGEFWVL